MGIEGDSNYDVGLSIFNAVKTKLLESNEGARFELFSMRRNNA